MALLNQISGSTKRTANPVVWAIRVAGLVLLIALIVNAVEAMQGKAALAYWHYPTLAICWLFGQGDKEKDDSERIKKSNRL